MLKSKKCSACHSKEILFARILMAVNRFFQRMKSYNWFRRSSGLCRWVETCVISDLARLEVATRTKKRAKKAGAVSRAGPSSKWR